MIGQLIRFEWGFYAKSFSFYMVLFAFLAFGVLVGAKAGIAFPFVTKNSPYAINFIFGLFSLATLFPIVVIAAQSLLREKDNQFDQILYSTTLSVSQFIISRFSVVFGITSLSFLLFISGYMVGHRLEMSASPAWGEFHFSYYIHSFVVLVLPTILFCASIVSSVAWFSKSRIAVYLTGLGIYILYMVVSIFTNSPIMANTSPMSTQAMNWAAKLDPFGIAAFYEQTRYWTAIEKNTTVLALTGNLLINRMAVVFIAFFLLLIASRKFKFKLSNHQKKKAITSSIDEKRNTMIQTVQIHSYGLNYTWMAVKSFISIDLRSTIKSIPFFLLTAGILFVLGMEMYGAIEGGIRVPRYYVTTSLMINAIFSTLPMLLLITMLFYGNELVWKSKHANFEQIENVTPYPFSVLLISKGFTLLIISMIFLVAVVILAIFLQIAYQYPVIDIKAYLSIFYYMGLPTLLCGILVLGLHYLIRNKYIALSLSALFLVCTNSSMGKALGFSHPAFRFANFLPDAFSEMAGLSYFQKAFFVNMFYSMCLCLIVVVLVLFVKKIRINYSAKNQFYRATRIMVLPVILFAGTCYFVTIHSNYKSKSSIRDWQYVYEMSYKKYKDLPQLSITDVQTEIDLYPSKNKYQVKGNYTLVNKSTSLLNQVLISTSTDFKWNHIISKDLQLKEYDADFGQYLFIPNKEIKQGDSIVLEFDFEYKLNPLQGHESFNAIVDNGVFIRMSRYFPHIGYDFDLLVDDANERKKMNLPPLDALKKIDAPLDSPYNYEFINFDALISTESDHSIVSVGELKNNYIKNNRTYYHYVANAIPFRFAVSSAKYELKRSYYNDIAIEIFYHPVHYQNIDHLVDRVKTTLAYCESNFGTYPYSIIRFAEISSFTRGFAATAYPATIYVTEKQLHLDINEDTKQDIINELAGHELSHQWWGNAQLHPDTREGSGILTETLAQYTELMMYKQAHGEESAKDIADLHIELYESEKSFSGEEPLYTSKPSNANVIYNKGLVKMYELYKLIGEEKINLALRSLLEKHRFPNTPATALDLMHELKSVSADKHQMIDELFLK